MDEASTRTCAHCGAARAGLFASDGQPVCDTCFSHDQITSNELRASQLTIRVPQEAGAERFLHRALRRGRAEFVYTLVLGAISMFLLHYGRHEGIALACGIVTTLLTIASALHSIGMLRYAREQAPEVYRHVTSRPPPRAARRFPVPPRLAPR